MNTYNHILVLKKLLRHAGISDERIQQYFCSAAEVERFISSVEDITKRIHALPPLPKLIPK